MKIRNQALLKRPWLFPVFTVIGATLGLFLNVPNGLSFTANVAIFIGVIAVLNVWFFVSLKRTFRSQETPEP